MVVVRCPRCESAVELHEGRPRILASGSVELWHRQCWDIRELPYTVTAIPRPMIASPGVRWIATAVGVSSMIAIGMAQWTWAETRPPVDAAIATVEIPMAESVAVHAVVTVHEAPVAKVVTVETVLQAKYEVPAIDGRRLDDQFTSLRNWTHPVTASPELMPEQASRHFGAERVGIDRPECGAGHCGIDLDGPRGRPIVAVASGTVVRVERHELGLDGLSGRYVRIEHDDGTLTAYMHMDDVEEHLQPGDHVEAGQYIGTLGATATYQSVAHLHFSLEVPTHPGHHGDITDTRYIDPAPFLVRATIAATPERRHPVKPAF
jgi:murein DD-endopeptidase MepM/ murein hydrolase activator NlpD